MHEVEKQEREDRQRFGCALAMLAVNTLLIGLVTASFTQGPYYNHEQEIWYRYASLGLFVAGSVMPAIALFVARRSRVVTLAAIALMAATFGAFLWYVTLSGGGV